jgi:hypothetical protein
MKWSLTKMMSRNVKGDGAGQEVKAEAGVVTGATRIGTDGDTTDAADMTTDRIAARTRGLTSNGEKGIAVEMEDETGIGSVKEYTRGDDNIMTGIEAMIGIEIEKEVDGSLSCFTLFMAFAIPFVLK